MSTRQVAPTPMIQPLSNGIWVVAWARLGAIFQYVTGYLDDSFFAPVPLGEQWLAVIVWDCNLGTAWHPRSETSGPCILFAQDVVWTNISHEDHSTSDQDCLKVDKWTRAPNSQQRPFAFHGLLGMEAQVSGQLSVFRALSRQSALIDKPAPGPPVAWPQVMAPIFETLPAANRSTTSRLLARQAWKGPVLPRNRPPPAQVIGKRCRTLHDDGDR